MKRIDERTALEQQLVMEAVERAIWKLPLGDLSNSGPFRVRVHAPQDADPGLIQAALERRLFREGIEVTSDEAASVPVLEANVVFAGNELEFFLLGVPIFVPGLPVALGDISLYRSSTQRGRARLGLAIWDENGTLVGHVRRSQGTSYFRNFSFLSLIGDFTSTDLDTFIPPGGETRGVVEED